MHEYSIVASLIDRVEREAARHQATHVHRLTLKIGELSGVEVELLKTAFDTFSADTICASAELSIERVIPVWTCPQCDCQIARGSMLRCDHCERPARMIRGDEIVLERIEMEACDV